MIYVSSDCMYQMIAALTIAVAVPRHCNYQHVMIREFYPCCDRQGPAVETVEGIAPNVMRKLTCLTYA
jgi:hypothetical protein